MAVAVGRIGHEDRLDVVGHLRELRTRLIVSLASVLIARIVDRRDRRRTAASEPDVGAA